MKIAFEHENEQQSWNGSELPEEENQCGNERLLLIIQIINIETSFQISFEECFRRVCNLIQRNCSTNQISKTQALDTRRETVAETRRKVCIRYEENFRRLKPEKKIKTAQDSRRLVLRMVKAEMKWFCDGAEFVCF